MLPSGTVVADVSLIPVSLEAILGPMAVFALLLVLGALATLVVAAWRVPRARRSVTIDWTPDEVRRESTARQPAA